MLPGVNGRQSGAIPLAAFSGEPGAFAEDAVHAYFGSTSTTLAVGGFREVFEAVAAERAAAGVVPIENLVNGTVRENYDLLMAFPLEIRGEVRHIKAGSGGGMYRYGVRFHKIGAAGAADAKPESFIAARFRK